MSRTQIPLLLILMVISSQLFGADRPPLVLPLWPDLQGFAWPGRPWKIEALTRRSRIAPHQGVYAPELTISWPEGKVANAPAAVICPGGGYAKVVPIDKEGHAIAKWLNVHGHRRGRTEVPPARA